MTASTEPLKIVSSRRTLIIMLVVCVLFAAMGVVVLALAPTKTLNLIVGVGAIGFFGVGGGIAFAQQWRRKRGDRRGRRRAATGRRRAHSVGGRGPDRLHLDDAGVRLRRYDTFLASLPRATEHTTESLRASRAQNTGWDLTWANRLLDRPPGEAARDLQRRRPAS
ncbi:hypothetical protein [Microbacterium elymi]|uniref:Uncharacterized protein n=1 Tax=Microbacterium elymi TaxID=2909587 RepID=A0ABY5NJ78_9MICO|nr:hypothetical protein [Microbacterium elymi]UUT35220.1 hypothetical protein L2X98_33950 [Microbacterium elymi]